MPIISELAIFLQKIERRGIYEEYFHNRMGISPPFIKRIDSYALGRVLQRAKPYRNTYSKIIRKEINTMVINSRWMLGKPICTMCNTPISNADSPT